MKYIWERVYPHVIALSITVALTLIPFKPITSTNIDSLVEGIVTLDSIIIGFVGAIIPVILSMKNESKLVKYVFERDNDGLFKKYISETIGYGLLDVSITLIVYLRDVLTAKHAMDVLSFALIYGFLLFLLSTYRSMSCMLKLIFSDDEEIKEDVSNKLPQSKSNQLWSRKGK